MIPKIIWQTHEAKYEDLQPFQKDIANTWKNLNPGWDYRYIDAVQKEKDVKAYSSIIYKCYKVSNKVNQADLWRIINLYQNGGIYADMDSVCIRPLSDVIDSSYNGQDMICTSEGGDARLGPTWPGSINCSNFGSVKNSKILKEILDEVEKKCQDMLETGQTSQLLTHPGIPVWLSFSNIAKKNKYHILFKDDYCYHSRRFKKSFNEKYEVTYNNESIDYIELATLNKWGILSR